MLAACGALRSFSSAAIKYQVSAGATPATTQAINTAANVALRFNSAENPHLLSPCTKITRLQTLLESLSDKSLRKLNGVLAAACAEIGRCESPAYGLPGRFYFASLGSSLATQ